MARVKAPLFSLDASGQVGQSIVFSKWKGQNYVRQQFTPQNPNTAGQVTQRGYFSTSVTGWQALTAPQKQAWEDAAAGTGISGFNLYMRRSIDALKNAQVPPVAP